MKSLVLIPSNTEHEMLQECVGNRWPRSGQLAVEICGVGLVASAVGATNLLNRFHPDQVFLVGIAGVLNVERVAAETSQQVSDAVGTLDGNAAADDSAANTTAAPNTAVSSTAAIVATSVVQHGVGVGEGRLYQSAEKMGFNRFNSDLHLQTPDQITLQSSLMNEDGGRVTGSLRNLVGSFLSVMSASSCPEEAEERRLAYPDAMLEDMETYSIALACHTAGVPLIAIRGISNVAGDRDFANWNSKAAMQAASDVLLDYLS